MPAINVIRLAGSAAASAGRVKPIVVTAAAPYIPQPLIDQLKVGARLVIPVGLPYMHQELMLVEKKENDEISTRDVLGVAFVPLTGKHE